MKFLSPLILSLATLPSCKSRHSQSAAVADYDDSRFALSCRIIAVFNPVIQDPSFSVTYNQEDQSGTVTVGFGHHVYSAPLTYLEVKDGIAHTQWDPALANQAWNFSGDDLILAIRNEFPLTPTNDGTSIETIDRRVGTRGDVRTTTRCTGAVRIAPLLRDGGDQVYPLKPIAAQAPDQPAVKRCTVSFQPASGPSSWTLTHRGPTFDGILTNLCSHLPDLGATRCTFQCDGNPVESIPAECRTCP